MNIKGLKYDSEKLALLAEKHKVMLVILYGSRMTGEADEFSDWDVAVMPKHSARPKWLNLLSDIRSTFETEVELAILTSDKEPLFKWEVFRQGIALYEDEPGRFNDEYVSAWKTYLDTAKLRRWEKEVIERF
jgi:predicted nucleotidyltransferase